MGIKRIRKALTVAIALGITSCGGLDAITGATPSTDDDPAASRSAENLALSSAFNASGIELYKKLDANVSKLLDDLEKPRAEKETNAGPTEKLSNVLNSKEIFLFPLEPSPKFSNETVGKPWRKRYTQAGFKACESFGKGENVWL